MKIRWVAVCIRLGLEKVPDTFLSLLVEMDQAIFNRNDFIGGHYRGRAFAKTCTNHQDSSR